jgi:hypothetical protein
LSFLALSFLAFSASYGNDLRPFGLTGGCKWCLFATRWKEVMDALLAGTLARDDVPKVNLAATSEAALQKVKMEELEAFRDGDGDGAKAVAERKRLGLRLGVGCWSGAIKTNGGYIEEMELACGWVAAIIWIAVFGERLLTGYAPPTLQTDCS